MATLELKRDIPVRREVDVFVAGGGPAGAVAAVVAARQGRSVFLAEGHTCLGGMGTAGLVPAYMQFSDGANMCAAGLGEEILNTLRAAGGTGTPENLGIKAEVLKRVYDDLLAGAGVDFTFMTALIDVVKDDAGRVTHAICAAKSGVFAVAAKMFIDGTGDGDLAAWAGAPFEKGDENGDMMPGTLCSLWADVDWDAVHAGPGGGNARLPEAFKDGLFTHHDMHLPGMWRCGTNVGGGNIGHTFGVDHTDERSITEALLWGRKLILEYERYYKEYLKGFEEMKLMTTGSLLGIRETRRIMGDYVLCLDDFKSRAIFDDEIGRYSYPVDIHPSRPDSESFDKFMDEWENLRYKKGENYGVPYRILTPQTLPNVLVTGRCVSTDRSMQGTIRVMPGCYITGQAAGMAAAIAIEKDTDTRGFDVSELQARLKEMGGFLPNC
jgi:ribulose 1,5-bisphosphate synthetase/thiazole synthase